MGYRRKSRTFFLTFEDDEYKGLEIEMRRLDVAGFLTLNRAAKGDDESSMVTMFRLFAKGVKSWNLEDDEGNPVPATYESVLELDADFVANTVAAWMEGMAGVDKELGKGSSSGATSPVPLPTMEAL